MKKNSSTKDLTLSNNERLIYEGNSIFKPKKYKNFNPLGFRILTFHAGFKKKLNDLLIILFDNIANSSNFYSNTSTPSAPIIWDKKYNKGKVKALIVNAGNANAHTGQEGLNIIERYVNFLSKKINCKKNEILVSSTGVIGEIFNPNLIISQIKKINNEQKFTLLDAATSIMTTDTYPKIVNKFLNIDNYKFRIFGFAKGSGMIHPNMGTMLAYIFIEADIPKRLLDKLIRNNLENTFNSISVDSDTSTSDTLVAFSLKLKKINLTKSKNLNVLNKGIEKVMSDLSLQIIKDGEGLTKLITVNVIRSKNKKQAKKIGFSIVNSPLVKTAIAGEDANWGRVIMAIGKTNENINQNKIKLWFGKTLVCKNGMVYKKERLSKLDKYMKNNIIEIKVDLNMGSSQHTVYGNDLSHKYININAEYRS